MDFSAPSPAGSSSGSSTSLDPPDALDLSSILQEDIIQDSNMVDWTQLSAVWQDMPDLGVMDFDPSGPIAVDPNMLSKSLEPTKPAPLSFDFDFPFTFNANSPLSSLSPSESGSDNASSMRRLSVSSSSPSIKSDSDVAAELAQRVLEAAGVVIAMPNSALTFSHPFSLHLIRSRWRFASIRVVVVLLFSSINTTSDNAPALLYGVSWRSQFIPVRSSATVSRSNRCEHHFDVVAS